VLKECVQTIGIASRIVDLALVALAWLAAFGLRFHVPLIEVTKGFPSFASYAALTPIIVVIWAFILDAQGVYKPQRMLRRGSRLPDVLRAHGVAVLAFIALTYLFSDYRYSRVVVMIFGLLAALGLTAGRLAMYATMGALRRMGHRVRNVLVVGEGRLAEHLIRRIDNAPELGLVITGVAVADDSDTTRVVGRPVVGHFHDITDAIRVTGANKVLVALPRHHSDQLDRILSKITDDTIDIQIIPDLHEYATIGCSVEDFDGLPVVRLNESPLLGWYALVKRLTDIAFSGAALVLLSPLFLLIAVAIKASSKGPVFYSQVRMGLDGRTFPMFKFRSMRVDAEASTGAVWARAGDDRRTAVGTFLRRTSLDELPQFWNVFLGNMSLVGPRPERPVFVDQFRHEIAHYMLRHKVKAGVTGWAQVNGWRGNTSLDERILCDLHYIRNWSYGLDLKIMLLTVWRGFVNKNAY
jgi:Undecaprenyl-phosphate glucose phosphotransferase